MAKRETQGLQPAALIGDGEGPYGPRLQSALPTHRGPASGSRWAAWAQAIAARYVAQAARRRPVGMWLVRLKTPFTLLREVIHRRPITLAPQIELGLVVLNRTVAMAASGSRGGRGTALRNEPKLAILNRTLAGGSRGERSTTPQTSTVVQSLASERALTHLLTRREQEAVQTEVIVRRLLARGERIEGFGHPGFSRRHFPSAPTARLGESREQAGEPATWQKPAPRPLAMVFRRPGVAPQEPEMAGWEQTPSTGTHPASPLMHSTLAQGLPQAPAMDVNRLTDQVIQTLDQRLTAWRERMGRI